jgi:hypothetical protein
MGSDQENNVDDVNNARNNNLWACKCSGFAGNNNARGFASVRSDLSQIKFFLAKEPHKKR